MSSRDSASPEPTTDRVEPVPAPDTPRTAPSAEAPSHERAAESSIRVELSGTPVSPSARTPKATPAAELPPPAPAGAEGAPVVRERRSELGVRPSIDTLLSAPVPADRLELQLDDRFEEIATRLRALEERTRRLELAVTQSEREPRQVPGWIWIVLLVGLALIAALLRSTR